MPLFEYFCRSCRKDFELLQLAGREVNKTCPSCASADVAEKISVFSAHGGGPSGPGPSGSGSGCGRCGDPQGPCGQ